MDVFQLDDWLIGEYEAFSRSFVQIRSEEIRRKVDAGYAERRGICTIRTSAQFSRFTYGA